MEHDDACLKCTLCVAACPVYRADTEFPGPKALGPEWWRRAQAGDLETTAHVDDCTFCQLCEAACPVSVPVAHLIQVHKSHRRAPALRRLRDNVLTRPDLTDRVPQLAAMRMPWDGLLGLARQSRRPRVQRPSPPRPERAGERTEIGLFIDCYSRAYDGAVVDAAEALLRLWGYEPVRMPQQSSCCGAAAYASGRPDQAKEMAKSAREQVNAVLARHPGIRTLVTLNGTCDETVRREWPNVYGLEAPAVQVEAFTEFALAAAPEWFWEQLRQVAEGERAYTHTTCRNRVARGDGALDALCRRAGLDPRSTGIVCCGAAGSYAFKAEHATVAHRMAAAAGPLPAEGSLGLLVDSGTCALHLGQETGVTARHPAWFLWTLWERGQSEKRG